MQRFTPVGIPERFRKKVEAFNQCEYARLNGLVITDVWEDGARVVMEIEGKHNPFGAVHGGAIFTLADQAFAISANQTDVIQVALSAKISYLSPPRGRLEAISRKVAETPCCTIFDVEVFDEERLVARFEGVAYRTA